MSSWISVSLAAMFALAVAPAVYAIAPAPARSPAQLAALLARYDHARPDEQRALEPQIDAMAGQRYAAYSRLFWYTELDEAQRAARRDHKPILALRMLGDLREDLSCANSRLFRAVLYANAEVSALLRDQFILYWSSERDVPVVTIDFGGGRKIVRTTTGNSAHYVLDADGGVLDILPGLYAPDVFRAELTKSLALARKTAAMQASLRPPVIAQYHQAAFAQTAKDWTAIHGRDLADQKQVESDLARAQRATMSKRVVEAPDLRVLGMPGVVEIPRDDAAAWAEAGQRRWHLVPGHILDASSRALVTRLHDAGPDGARTTPAQLEAVIARLEQHLIGDTAINEFLLRPQIHDRLESSAFPAQRGGQNDFASLNDWLYATVFATPKSDAWLGLNPRTDFSGLPGDGVVVP